jgi:pimeloyl-ACP methyl ester carboxylesterase
MQRPRQATAPTWVHDGLAVYDLGTGPPLLVMPNPQGMVRAPEACSPLVDLLVGLGWRVVTFDPPGAFASAHPARLGLEEMLACTQEALAVAGVAPPVTVVGHSQATLCQLALALACPVTVGSLVLVGAVDGGWRSTRRAGGMPWCWPLTDPRRWRFAALAAPLAAERADLIVDFTDVPVGNHVLATWARTSRSAAASRASTSRPPIPTAPARSCSSGLCRPSPPTPRPHHSSWTCHRSRRSHLRR